MKLQTLTFTIEQALHGVCSTIGEMLHNKIFAFRVAPYQKMSDEKLDKELTKLCEQYWSMHNINPSKKLVKFGWRIQEIAHATHFNTTEEADVLCEEVRKRNSELEEQFDLCY